MFKINEQVANDWLRVKGWRVKLPGEWSHNPSAESCWYLPKTRYSPEMGLSLDKAVEIQMEREYK